MTSLKLKDPASIETPQASFHHYLIDHMTYVPMLFTLQHILHIYDNFFGLLPHESMWQEYERDLWGHDPRRKRTAKSRPVSTHIPIEMNEDENEQASRKDVNFADNMVITETIVLIYPLFKFFLIQMLLFKYFIDNVV